MSREDVIAALPRRWSRRVLAIYIVATVFGGVVLTLLLVLLGLLYWMTAPVALPPAEAFVTSKSDSAIIIRVEDASELPPAILEGVTRGLPTQAQRIFQSVEESRLQIVGTNAVEDGNASMPFVAISLSRSPGRFWLVRRDLERRVEKGTLPYGLAYFEKQAVFIPEEQDTSPVFCLSGCSLLRADEKEAVSKGIALLNAEPAEGTMPPIAITSAAGFVAWSNDAKHAPPLEHILSGPLLARWNRACDMLLGDFPDRPWERLSVGGEFFDRRGIEVRLLFTVSPAETASVAKRTEEWINRNKSELGLEEPIVTAREGAVQLDFSVLLEEK
jgi:hypothetical protein